MHAGRPIRRILVAEGSAGGPMAEIVRTARSAGIRVERVPREVLDRLATTRAHQGVIAEAESFRYRPIDEALTLAETKGETPLLLALDGITDPGNLGSLLRSAEAAGAHGVLIPKHKAAAVTPVVEKASSGALEHLILDRVTNLGAALVMLRERGLWVVALDASEPISIWDCDLLSEPLVLVVGAEGRGVGRLIRERADAVVSVPMRGRVGSLNAAVAGALALFETVRKRRPGPGPASA